MKSGAFLAVSAFLGVATAGACSGAGPAGGPEETPEPAKPYEAQHQRMIREIEADVRATRQHIGKNRLDRRVMEAMARVPRHEFVPPGYRDQAYENHPLPIGEGQTISQPYIVALMTDLLEVDPDDVVLEIGTGSGYQAAVLAELAGHVYSIEIIDGLSRTATETLERLGYENVTTKVGDGYRGWPEHAPFDGVIVTAAAPEIPPPLLEQLRPGGRMVIPVASGFWGEQLVLVTKDEDGEVHTRDVLPVRFVPLTGDH